MEEFELFPFLMGLILLSIPIMILEYFLKRYFYIPSYKMGISFFSNTFQLKTRLDVDESLKYHTDNLNIRFKNQTFYFYTNRLNRVLYFFRSISGVKYSAKINIDSTITVKSRFSLGIFLNEFFSSSMFMIIIWFFEEPGNQEIGDKFKIYLSIMIILSLLFIHFIEKKIFEKDLIDFKDFINELQEHQQNFMERENTSSH